ncbi:LacI family DNA-binding transcriptional regulator [Novosphingobium sp. UBA1939]|uniref:LacI family DNA-binding transcriptional regulator n=1 Tax=Novosphingobium sp. UBA1939 TaxID=1946982 RepID=UPI0025D0A161|nr:LacI family DNA-binding transcriptional regulator [Novosphingobium sp. UBA1939]
MVSVKNLKEFAELAGVSTATASRALTGSGRVSDETRKRISALAEKLGYQPNIAARNLRTQRTMTIGVLVPLGHEALQHLSDPFFNTMTGFLADAFAENGYDMLLSRVLPRNDRWMDRFIASGRVDGIIVVGQSDQFHIIETVSRRYRPMVVWGGHSPGQHHCSIGSDNRLGGRLAAMHLVERGCTRIAYAGPVDGSEFGERIDGARMAVLEAGLPPLQELPTHFEPDAAYADVRQKLETLSEMPDGIVAGSDVTAISVIRALRDLGRRVPDDVRVIGYDGLPIGEHMSPPLSTIDQQLRHGAQLLTETLLRRIGGEETASQQIEPRLIVRASS